MAGLPPENCPATPTALDDSRLTCPEYVAFVTVQVVQHMDAIAWARVHRKTRVAELVQHLEVLHTERSEGPTLSRRQRYQPESKIEARLITQNVINENRISTH